jgi:hypothetical protein
MPHDLNKCLTVLSDILRSQHEQMTPTRSEYDQVLRLTDTLLKENGFDEDFRFMLIQIQQYSEAGLEHDRPGQWADENRNDLDHWVQLIDVIK